MIQRRIILKTGAFMKSFKKTMWSLTVFWLGLAAWLGPGALHASPCPSPTPIDPAALQQFDTFTAPGPNYTLVQADQGNNFSVAIPAGDSIYKAYFWLVKSEGNPPADPNATFCQR